MLRAQSEIQEIPLKIVGSTVFGRYPKISVEETYNMLISDDGLVDYAGYNNVLTLLGGSQGRGLYTSTRANVMIAVVGNTVVSIDSSLTPTTIGQLSSSTGDVFISENNNEQIVITDYENLYVYNYSGTGTTFFIQPINFTPGFITFQNGRFICADVTNSTLIGGGTPNWRLSDFNAVTFNNAAYQGELQTKPDTCQGVIPIPGRGNSAMVFGHTVAELWTDMGQALFPYIRNQTFNLDYGVANINTLASNQDLLVFIATNEKSGPAIMYTTGGDIKKISTDGIDFRLSQLTNPQDASGFLFRQDGHLIYQFTFKTDNLSYIYDFNTGKFFTVTDENLNYHIAKRVVAFNNSYFFVSFNDGNLYEFGTQYTTYQYSGIAINAIPRIRITPPLRIADQRWYIVRSLGFTIENGEPNTFTYVPIPNTYKAETDITTEGGVNITTEGGLILSTEANADEKVIPISSARVDLSISRDGGDTFSNSWGLDMNMTGKRKSRFIYQQLGIANDSSYQLRFWGFKRFVAFDGIVEVRR